MAASVFDSPMFAKSFPTGEAARLFSDSAAVRAVLLVQGTLAKVQGELGGIPEESAFFIHRSSMEVQIDPAGLAVDLARDGFAQAVCTAFQKAMEAPEHSRFIQQGVAPAEIEAAARALRLRQFISHCEQRLDSLGRSDAKESLTEARNACVGLHVTTDLTVAKALSDALKLPLLPAPADVRPMGKAAIAITHCLSKACAEEPRFTQLSALSQGLIETLDQDATLADLCLPQICLAAAAALEIAETA